MGHRVDIDARAVATAVARRTREPIIDLLALFLLAAPSPEVMTEWAQRNPGAWIKAILELAEVVGYGPRPAPRPLRTRRRR